MTAPPGYAPVLVSPHRMSREESPESRLRRIIDAPSQGAATAALVAMAPDWSVSRCSRVAASIRARERERVARAVLYAMLPAALSDGGFRSRRAVDHSDATGERGVHNAYVLGGGRI